MCAFPADDYEDWMQLKDEKQKKSTETARIIIEKFEKFKLQDRFFAVDDFRNFICPQEYKSAINVLKETCL